MSDAKLAQAKVRLVTLDMATTQMVDAPDRGDGIVAGRLRAGTVMHGISKNLPVILLVLVSSLCLPSLAQSKEKRLTESQRVLNKVMEDIRHCDKTTPYGYDSRTKTISPPELKKIKGLKLKKLYREIAVFEIDEQYEGLHAKVLWVLRSGQRGYLLPGHSVAFGNSYKMVRERLEQRWGIPFVDETTPITVRYNGPSAEFTMMFDEKPRTLSIAKMPAHVYPHIPLPDVGCNQVGQ